MAGTDRSTPEKFDTFGPFIITKGGIVIWLHSPTTNRKTSKTQKRIRGILKELPPFCTDFFRGIEPRTSARTRLAYAYDLKTFFDFLKQANPELKSKKLRDLPLSFWTKSN